MIVVAHSHFAAGSSLRPRLKGTKFYFIGRLRTVATVGVINCGCHSGLYTKKLN